MATMTTQQLFDDAVEKYHLLLTGQAVVEVQDQNGEKIRYTGARKSDLAAYIATLASLLGVASPIAAAPRGPMRFFF